MTTEQEDNRPGKSLPPMVGSIKEGKIAWKRTGVIDYELMGYFLACHLIVEHYMDELLKISLPSLDWDAAKLTFGQRIALLTKISFPPKYDCVPAIKHMNSIRNKLSHKIDYAIDQTALLPLVHYLQRATDGKNVPDSAMEILDMFTSLCCASLAGSMSYGAHEAKMTRD